MNTPKPINPLAADEFVFKSDTETACIQQGPHSIIQGEVINRLPGNRVVIRCNGRTYKGPEIKPVRRNKA